MHDTWVDDALPVRAPSKGFVAGLRAELEDDLSGVQPVTPSGRSRPRRWPRAMAGAISVAAAALAIVVLVARRIDDESRPTTHSVQLARERLVTYLAGGRWTLLDVGNEVQALHRSLMFDASATSLTVDDGCRVATYPVVIDDQARVLDGPAVVVQVRLPSPVPECNGVPVSAVVSLEGYRLAGSRGVVHLQLSPLTTGSARGVGAYVLQVPDLGGVDP